MLVDPDRGFVVEQAGGNLHHLEVVPGERHRGSAPAAKRAGVRRGPVEQGRLIRRNEFPPVEQTESVPGHRESRKARRARHLPASPTVAVLESLDRASDLEPHTAAEATPAERHIQVPPVHPYSAAWTMGTIGSNSA